MLVIDATVRLRIDDRRSCEDPDQIAENVAQYIREALNGEDANLTELDLRGVTVSTRVVEHDETET